ncbi:hypothetical protein [Streptomyces sp. KLOTTS4A1]|uniref:hypothetical protein n=1 Tax=Streptomyces sp. KLOTTS4A1 TaxID=3390996 RepID=UPI0039F4F888
MSKAPITSLPSNDYLPESVHALADQWRAADQHVKDIRRHHREATSALPDARNKDAEAIKAAAIDGRPLPDPEHETATLARIDNAKQALPIVEAERDSIGRRLVVALRDDQARGHLVDAAAATMHPALAAYREALDKAERALSYRYRMVREATELLHVVEALDTGAEVRLHPKALSGMPDFYAARYGADQVAKQLSKITTRTPPSKRHVRLTDGRVIHVPSSLAADFLRDGKVEAWLDGWPPEQPSPRLPGAPASQANTRFIPRSERGDAA